MRWLALVGLAACSAKAAPETHVPAVSTVVLRAASASAVVTSDDAVYVFDRDRVSVMRNGAVDARANVPPPATAWDGFASLVGPDGATWTVGVAGRALWRVTAGGELEVAGDRLGVGDSPVRAVAGFGATFVIGLDDGYATSRDGLHVSRFTGAAAPKVAAAKDVVAIVRGDTVEIDDLAAGTRTTFAIAHVDQLGFIDAASAKPHLVVVAGGDVYIQERGALRRQAMPRHVRDIAIASERVWLLGDDGLHVLDHHALARIDSRVAGTKIFPAPNGEVWVAGSGELARYAIGGTVDQATWQSRVAPIFARSCKKCHEPGGEADFDLSTVGAWSAARDKLRGVLANHEMPPPEAPPLSDADRAALQAWLEAANALKAAKAGAS